MLKRIFNVLKNNSSIVLLYLAYQVIAFLILILLYPNNVSEFVNEYSFDFIAFFGVMSKMLLATVIIEILGMLISSGWGNMLTEAIRMGKTTIKSFLPGVRIYFTRILLSTLLLNGVYILISILLGVVASVVIFALIMTGTAVSMGWSMLLILVMVIILMIPMPFVLLWYPSIFIDDTGVIQGLKNGAKAGAKNYWRLILILMMLAVPIGIQMAVTTKNTSEDFFTPEYMMFYLIEALISTVIIPSIFLIYQDYRQANAGYEMKSS